ncbi:hypothetical protein CXG81DRAFT_20805 [Caulochytrium protostelioides]|uniref:Cleavage stimulation factor 50 kDa subunit n=1 Tax=Caulochytrium protostelioides TaxID=1555241 RepID=A0A4P9X204_9FUNG|nr:hypothetical protein CXG81DRAFT_20805 [Caulochytrium protostelioides]|eukprot:RKO99063.1 hypothetical protein CXG81DRAFT_20805 [Caulochytrium protostelioides]
MKDSAAAAAAAASTAGAAPPRDEPEVVPAMSQETLLPLMISQLKYWQLDSLAQVIATVTQTTEPTAPSNELAEICAEVLDVDDEPTVLGGARAAAVGPVVDDAAKDRPMLDLDRREKGHREQPWYDGVLSADHETPCSAGSLSLDGQYMASGSRCGQIKIFDLSRIRARSHARSRLLLRKIAAHPNGAVNDLRFHPSSQFLASASADATIKLFTLDSETPYGRRPIRVLTDAAPVTCIDFHPAGTTLLAGANHPTMRLWDVETSKCFTMPVPDATDGLRVDGLDAADAVAGLRSPTGAGAGAAAPPALPALPTLATVFSPRGDAFAVASGSGAITLYDTASGAVRATLPRAHGGAPVSNVHFSRNEKYLLSTGGDGVAKLWDLKTGSAVVVYSGALSTSMPMRATLIGDETCVAGGNGQNGELTLWDARTGAVLRTLPAHDKPVRVVVASEANDSFLTCSEEGRARYFRKRI